VRRTLSAVRHSLRAVVVATTALSALAASALAYGDGIDISHWQGTVNWTKVRSDDVTFAFMKATEGTNYADPTLQRNWTGAENVGIYRAAYHFARPSAGSAVAQAKFFVAKAGRFQDKGDLPPVLDLEATGGLSPAALRAWVSTWLTTVEDLTGRTPILYFSPYFWVDHMGNSKDFTRYPLWIAHYTSTGPMVPGGWSTWTFWQRTSSGHVDGIAGSVDMNRFNGNAAALASLARTTTGSTAPVTAGPTLPVGDATTLTMTPGATAPVADAAVTFTGDLTRTTPVARLAGKPVELWSRRTGGAWARAAGGTTDAAGHYSLTTKVPATSEYQTRFLGDASFAPSVSAPVNLTATAPEAPAAPAATKLYLRKDKVAVRKGAPLMLYGHLMTGADGVAGEVVRYYKRSPAGGSWVYVGKSTSKAPTGWHSLVVRPHVTRVWKAVFAGSSRYQTRTSAYLTVSPR
jgi:GH25 family lysozyme M1 (1,4-beta-N-acetylmuramidase)